jgi:hypothetical protein
MYSNENQWNNLFKREYLEYKLLNDPEFAGDGGQNEERLKSQPFHQSWTLCLLVKDGRELSW